MAGQQTNIENKQWNQFYYQSAKFGLPQNGIDIASIWAPLRFSESPFMLLFLCVCLCQQTVIAIAKYINT